MSTTVPRASRAATAGGALWALLPVASAAASFDDTRFATAGHVAVALSYWVFAVLPPVLILLGLREVRRTLGAGAGRAGRIGLAVSAVGLAAMALGNGIEVAALSAGAGEVALGHALFLTGFLVTVLGSLPLGVVLYRRRRDRSSRVAGVLLTLVLPLGIGIAALGAAVGPDHDAWFWAAITVPTGVAWVLLGGSPAGARPPVGEPATAV